MKSKGPSGANVRKQEREKKKNNALKVDTAKKRNRAGEGMQNARAVRGGGGGVKKAFLAVSG